MQKKEALHAVNQGEIKLGELTLQVAVLNNTERVISIRGLANFLGVKGGGTYWKMKKGKPDNSMLPEFVSAQYLEPYITDEVKELLINTLTYSALNGQPAEGIKAKILPKICDVWVKALNGGKLNEKQREVANRAYLLLSAFAEIGITALIDEVTGYQKQKNAYEKILELYIAKELQPWIMTFDENYYKQLYRLLNWDWDAFKGGKKNHPQYIGKLTNRLVYEKLAPGVLGELQKINPKDGKGVRKHKHFQHLSENHGYRELIKHLAAISILMEQFSNGKLTEAISKIDARFPSFTPFYQTSIDFLPADKGTFDALTTRASLPAK